MQKRQVDVVVIGAGTAGMTAYKAAKRSGKNVVLVEANQYGTTCARVGCMPSKLLIAAADAASNAAKSHQFGVFVDSVRIDGKAVMQRVRDERDRFVSFVLKDIASFPELDKVKGKAYFVDSHTIQVDQHTQLQTESVVLATGSEPFVPDSLLGAKDRFIQTDDVFYWKDLPKKLVIVGAGVIGLELGVALAQLGVEVTVLNRSQRIAGIEDPEVLAVAQDLIGQTLHLELGARVNQAEVKHNQVLVYYEQDGNQKQVSADFVLGATGRRPAVANLGLENTAAQLDDKGMPLFNARTLQINGSSIFFAGDVNALHPLLHEATDDGYQAGLNAARWPDTPQAVRRRAPLSIIFSEPQIMRVGATYNELDLSQTRIGTINFKNQGRSRIMAKNAGLLRIYAQADNGRFLGAEMIGPAAEHLAHLLAWSLQMELSIHQMLEMPFYHPVIEEGLRTALRDAARS